MHEPTFGQNDLYARIGRVFAGALHIEVPAADTDLFETGVLDSLGFVTLLVALEQEFGVAAALDDLEVDNFRTIERIAAFLVARAATALAAGE